MARTTHWPGVTCILVLASATLAAVVPARAQQPASEMSVVATGDGRYSVTARGVRLVHALQELVTASGLSLLYDPALVRDVETFCVDHRLEAEGVLRCLLKETPLDFYRLSSGTYVLHTAPQQRPQFGQLAGLVIDGETGEPLPYANVVLADVSTGTAANEAGLFSFGMLLPGTYRIETSYVGYQSALDSIVVPAGAAARTYIALRPRPIVVDPVVVNGLQQRLPSRTMGYAEAGPDALEGVRDVPRAVDRLLGIALRSPLADLHIQGGASSEHQFTLDGAPVFHPLALGRFLGAFSPLAIGRLTVHKAGFGARVGSQLSGVVQAEHQLAGRGGERAALQVDPLNMNVRGFATLRLSPNIHGPAMVAVRGALWDVYRNGALTRVLRDWNAVDPALTAQFLRQPYGSVAYAPRRQTPALGYSDLHAATRLSFGPYRRLFLSAYRGANALETELLADVQSLAEPSAPPHLLLTRERYDWRNALGVMRYEWLASSRVLASVKGRGSRHVMAHDYGLADEALLGIVGLPALEDSVASGGISRDRNEIAEYALSASIDYSLSAADHFEIGVEGLLRENVIHLNTPFFAQTNARSRSESVVAYAEHRRTLGPHLQGDAGVRATFVPAVGSVFVEPRAALRYDVAHSLFGIQAVRLAVGLYRQFVGEFDLSSVGPTALSPSVRFWYPIDETVPFPKAIHAAAEWLWAPAPAWSIGAEAYYKWQPVLLAVNYPALLGLGPEIPRNARHAHFIESARGRAFGGGGRVERQGDRGWVSASYSYSASFRTYASRFGGQEVTSPWNEPHRVSLAFDRYLTAAWRIRARWQGIWGRRWGFRRAYYDWLNAHAGARAFPPFDLSRPDADDQRLPPFTQLDLGLSYVRYVGRVNVQMALDVVNVLDRRNVVDWSLVRADGGLYRPASRAMPGIAPVVTLGIRY